jgi:hypothetical protein
MAVENPTAANVSLWTHFLKHELGLDGRRARSSDNLSRATAAAVSTWLTLMMAPRIGRLYRENAPHVTSFGFTASGRDHVEPPVPPEMRRAEFAPRRESTAPERRRHYERRSNSTAGATSAATTRSETATISH